MEGLSNMNTIKIKGFYEDEQDIEFKGLEIMEFSLRFIPVPPVEHRDSNHRMQDIAIKALQDKAHNTKPYMMPEARIKINSTLAGNNYKRKNIGDIGVINRLAKVANTRFRDVGNQSWYKHVEITAAIEEHVIRTIVLPNAYFLYYVEKYDENFVTAEFILRQQIGQVHKVLVNGIAPATLSPQLSSTNFLISNVMAGVSDSVMEISGGGEDEGLVEILKHILTYEQQLRLKALRISN